MMPLLDSPKKGTGRGKKQASPDPYPPFDVTKFYANIDIEHEIIRTLARDGTRIAMLIVMHFVNIEHDGLWKDASDHDGQPFPSWEAYLRWAGRELNVSRATYYRGVDAYKKFHALGLTDDAMLNAPPATLDKVCRLLTEQKATDSGVMTLDWKPEVYVEAEKSGVSPAEKAEEIISLPRTEVLAAARAVVPADTKITYSGEYVIKDEIVKLEAYKGDKQIGFFYLENIDDEIVADIEQKLRCMFERT